MEKDVVVKAKRRIKRYIATKDKMSRVRDLGAGYYRYVVKHVPLTILDFRVDSIGRLRLQK